MKKLLTLLYGDKTIWALVVLLALFSFLPVYSASTNLVYTVGTGKHTSYYLAKHLVHLGIGFCILWIVHKWEYRYFRQIAIIGIPVMAVVLFITLLKGNTIGGANASRWMNLPVVGQFQPSSTAAILLLMYVAQYLTGIKDKAVSFWPSFWELWTPVLVIVGLILPANFSTAALIFCMVCVLVFVGKYPFKYLATIVAAGVMFMGVFVLAAKAFPGVFPNRVDTWISRIDRFAGPDDGTKDLYQVENAKIAIAKGGIFGVGPGKSVQKNFLPQSSSDFIYAIIVEELGIVGGLTVLGIYLLLFFRFLIAAHKAPTLFGKLLVTGLGFYLIFQALINMGVAVSLLPTTGQALPLVSSGGTAIWMTCFAIGVILSVTKKESEIQQEELDKQERLDREQEELARLYLERQQKEMENEVL
ncbi:FtsW/RodA/SpoVE family cell cycle protein [Myroides indicus]|uniref:Probable peptidoglycan glycosyltransferase FtsW n=1 Tax=Myroides indicus TaxID=1323422 RepID=A0A4R7EX75_9FLAO|nr:FtsW/RodA/SpoVE family cell cycle protein [Myroides indicus]TDS56926.1 cell division protein FtsW [Myroides indicus]